MVKYIFRSCLLFCVITSLVGCTSVEKNMLPAQNTQTGSREDLRAHLAVFIDTPFTPSSPTRQIWYGWVRSENLLRTAKHLVESNFSRLVITNNEWTVCPVQYIRTHPTKDIALLQTALPCFTWIPLAQIQQGSIPSELIYIDSLLKKAPIIKSSSTSELLLDTLLTPGMSGSPLFLSDGTIVGIITAQQSIWTEFIALSPALITSWPEIQKILQ